MRYKIFFPFAIILYFLVLFQTSFLPHFSILGHTPNIVLLVVVLWNILENEKEYTGLLISLISGFFLDIFSSSFMGFNVLVFLSVAFVIKFLIKKHVKISVFQRS
jgi:rod shape-determining protein MreD